MASFIIKEKLNEDTQSHGEFSFENAEEVREAAAALRKWLFSEVIIEEAGTGTPLWRQLGEGGSWVEA